MLVAGIKRILPEGDIFGTVDSDEFMIELDGTTTGIFKRFEYLSLPFSMTGNRNKFDQLITNARKNGTSFKEELDIDIDATFIVDNFLKKMSLNPAFSKQVLDCSLGRVYVDDNIISKIETKNSFEDNLSKIVFSWNHLSDFYCIEGLVGGDGVNNPFREEQKSSFVAGALDSLETNLPILKQKVETKTWNKVCLQLSSIVGREYSQINSAVNVLGAVHGTDKDMSDEEVQQSLELINELSGSTFETNTDIGKLYNSLIRFHNWMPIALKSDDLEGDTYDSICNPTKKVLELLDCKSNVSLALSKVTDATSPKGLALVSFVDGELIGDKNELIRRSNDLDVMLLNQIKVQRNDLFSFNFKDPTFYSGLTGGKWKGLKLLNDAKEVLDLSYHVPDGFAISSMFTEKIFHETGIEELLKENIFSIDEAKRKQILNLVDEANFSANIDDKLLSSLGSSVIVRSSMYGEDGSSNFSGTYDSVACESNDLEFAIKEVVKSYFSKEAIASREDIGLSHNLGVSYVVQKKISGEGGVIHLTKNNCSLSFASTPEDAVMGNGNHQLGRTIKDAIRGTPLDKLGSDFDLLYNVFGDSDIEFVIDKDSNVYLTQLRPKYFSPELANRDIDADEIQIKNLEDLKENVLDKEYVVKMDFLGRDNMMNHEGEIMDFIRQNKQYILAVKGTMPGVAHIPNKIEGHFRIPYLMEDVKND